MVVRIRLARFGATHRASYRIVVADARCPRDGRHIEQVGSYDPIPKRDGSKEIRLNSERIKYWLSVGAQPSERVEKMLSMAAIIPAAPRRPSSIRHIPKADRPKPGKKFFSTAALAPPLAAPPLVSCIGSGLPVFGTIAVPTGFSLAWSGLR